MGVNLDKMKKKHSESQRSGEFWKIEEGEYKVYVHPPCREDDEHEPTAGLPYIEIVVHYSVGRDNAMVVCLDPEKNPILEHPFVKEFLKKRKIKLTGHCPVCEGIEDMDEADADDCRPQTKWLWGLTPMFSRRDSRDEYHELTPRPSIALAGVTIYDGIMSCFGELGNITDFNAAMLAKIGRKGKGKTGTKYKVEVDITSAKDPIKFGKSTRRAILKALEKGGDCDLFKVVGNLTRGPAEIAALLSGVSVEKDTGGDDGDGGVKPCFGIDYADDDECNGCPDVDKCREEMGGIKEEADPDGDDDDYYGEGDDDDYGDGDDEYDPDDDDYGDPEDPEDEDPEDEEPEPDPEPEDDGLDALEQELAAASKRKRRSKTTVEAKTTSKKSSKAASSKKAKATAASSKKTNKAAESKPAASSKKTRSKSASSKKTGGRVSKRRTSKE